MFVLRDLNSFTGIILLIFVYWKQKAGIKNKKIFAEIAKKNNIFCGWGIFEIGGHVTTHQHFKKNGFIILFSIIEVCYFNNFLKKDLWDIEPINFPYVSFITMIIKQKNGILVFKS